MAQFASDSFTGVDGTTLQAHDANWVEHPSSAGGDMLITANRLQQRVSGEGFYYHSGSPSSADYSVSADLYTASYSPAFNATGVIGRTNTTANTFYHARHRVSGGWELYRRVTGTFTLLGSSTVSTPSVGTTVNLKLDMVGSTIRLLVNGTELASAVDASITAAGKSGLRISNASAQTASEGFHLDNFSADDAGGGGTSATGSSTGLATASGVGASVAASTGSSTGLATVSGVGDSASSSGATGSAAGSSTVSGVGASTAASSGSVDGVAAVTGIGASVAASTGSASGSATASGVGDSSIPGSATGASAGSATVSGVGASVAASTGTASGSATVLGVSENPDQSQGGDDFPYVIVKGKKKKRTHRKIEEIFEDAVKEVLGGEPKKLVLGPAPKPTEIKQLAAKEAVLGPAPAKSKTPEFEGIKTQPDLSAVVEEEAEKVSKLLAQYQEQVRLAEIEEDEELLMIIALEML